MGDTKQIAGGANAHTCLWRLHPRVILGTTADLFMQAADIYFGPSALPTAHAAEDIAGAADAAFNVKSQHQTVKGIWMAAQNTVKRDIQTLRVKTWVRQSSSAAKPRGSV
ncbi:hypothetical protein [Roseobacter sp.]|uniref:hypothetical protein n=1 Tax=Roseobacter sp. TaxID=1907202 RepID=UPI003298409C